jgi:hypothetical protein
MDPHAERENFGFRLWRVDCGASMAAQDGSGADGPDFA